MKLVITITVRAQDRNAPAIRAAALVEAARSGEDGQVLKRYVRSIERAYREGTGEAIDLNHALVEADNGPAYSIGEAIR